MDGDALVEKAALVTTREEFLGFLREVIENLQSHPAEWENNNLDTFLSGLRGFTQQADGYYANMGERIDCEVPSWRLFADILLAAKVFE